MLLGYYYADGRYGDHFQRQSPHTNLYRMSRSGVLGNSAGEIAAALLLGERAARAGKVIQLALDINSPNVGPSGWKPFLRTVMRQQSIVDRIVAIELRDEPEQDPTNWTESKIRQRVETVRTILAGRLGQVPLGITLASQDVLNGLAYKYNASNGIGYVACEAYLSPEMWDPVLASQTVRKLVKSMKEKTPGSVDFWVVGQSYDLSGRFGPAAALKAIQIPTYEAAAEAEAKGLVWFSFGRPGGVESYPRLKQEHREIARREGFLHGVMREEES